MTFNQNQYQFVGAQLIGNVDIPRNVHPLVRASTRRSDPDLISSAPYYSGATGKTLQINYTKEVASVVTPTTVTIQLTGDDFATILADINAEDPDNLLAVDLDGFLAIKNLNPGKTHHLTITSFSPSVDDAAPILGFAKSPAPGSTSFAGEIASSPGSRTQLNPHPTALLAKDNTLSSAEINRGFAALLQVIENLRAELAREVIVYKDIPLTFNNHPVSTAKRVARINDDSYRLFCPETSGDGVPRDLEPYYRVLNTDHQAAINLTDYTPVRVTQVYYATDATALSATQFTTWGTPTGESAIGNSIPNRNKHAVTSISSIVGNLVTCSLATFLTNKVAIGDFVEITASVLQPFDHSGWYVVDGVLSETSLALRPMSFGVIGGEQPVEGGENRPRCLNPLGSGTLRVAVGRFIPAGDLWLEVDDTAATDLIIRAPVGSPFRELQVIDQRNFSGNLGVLSNLLLQHVTDTSSAHTASSIGGFTSASVWRDSTNITGANLKATIEDILTDLAAQSASNSGSGRVGAQAISIGGSSPNTLAQGTLLSQLTALLTALRDHVNLASGAHAATAISYAGGNAWADGTTNPATTVEAQLDKIISDLGGSAGAAKIGFGGSSNWADGTTNPAATAEAQFDKIVSDLAASTGTAKIGGAATGTDIAAATAAVQIADLAVNWLKMGRVNTISAAQTFSALITANAGIDVTTSFKRKYVRSFIIPAAMASPNSMLHADGNRFEVGTYTGRIVFPIAMSYPTNSATTRLTRWLLRVQLASGGSCGARLYKYDAFSHVETPLGTLHSLTSGSTLFNTGLTIDTTLGVEQLYVAFVGSGMSGDFVYDLEYDLVDQ
jgi:hypothetical protein